jgi:phosphoribosylanthranilate isomerase
VIPNDTLGTKVKICGLTRRKDVELAATLGAWALGFIFYEKSPRATTAKNVREILKGVGPEIKAVGVFVNADLETILETVAKSGINTVQLHGDETVEFCQQLRKFLTGIGLIKAFRPNTGEDLKGIRFFTQVCDQILLDAYVPNVPGGTGATANWNLAIQAKKIGSFILAGGLGPENVADAIQRVSPDAIDASSRLEEAPGIKSHEKLRAFFHMIRSMETR